MANINKIWILQSIQCYILRRSRPFRIVLSFQWRDLKQQIFNGTADFLVFIASNFGGSDSAILIYLWRATYLINGKGGGGTAEYLNNLSNECTHPGWKLFIHPFLPSPPLLEIEGAIEKIRRYSPGRPILNPLNLVPIQLITAGGASNTCNPCFQPSL